jgi:hypothetical protein
MSDLDIEMGITPVITPVATPVEGIKDVVATEEEVGPGVGPNHTTAELLKRARDVTASGQFIFSGFSEMNVFVLLQFQDHILRLQRKLHDSAEGVGSWSDDDTKVLHENLKQYRTTPIRYLLTPDEALSTNKTVLSWDRPPFRDSHSAAEFLFGKQPPPANGTATIPPLRTTSYSSQEETFVKDFGETDYIDLCPENSNALNSYLRRRLPEHFQYNSQERRVVAHLKGPGQTENQSPPTLSALT